MKKKASGRKEKRIVISLGDRLHVAQKLENKEITPKEAQEILQVMIDLKSWTVELLPMWHSGTRSISIEAIDPLAKFSNSRS
jgi:hypothetical protein